jgi:rhamnosyltransferase
MKRILFFVHYNKYSYLADYIVYLLEHIKHIYSRIVFISNSQISSEDCIKLSGLYDDIIIRENKGFDFGAWKDALLQEGWDKLLEYDNVTLMNDTCFGPIFELEPVYVKMEQQNVDFWGLTNNEKIQKDFLCFNSNIVGSKIFKTFWNNVQYFTCMEKAKASYKMFFISLSQKGFIYNIFCTSEIPSLYEQEDTAMWYPDLIIKNNIPFLKIKSIIFFSYPKYVIDLLYEKTNYPIDLIFDYVTEYFDPNISLKICNKLIPAVNLVKCSSISKIAIHLHVFYLDIFKKYLDLFNNISYNFDLYITTDTKEKENKIKEYIINTKIGQQLKEIIITQNKGRDIFPWLTIVNRLNKYDFVGHFHTKKTKTQKEWHGILWLQEILELILLPFNTIIETFQKNPTLGIIIPDIPLYPYLFQNTNFNDLDMHSALKNLWERMKCKKEITFKNLDTIIMSYGTMFWYRPKALQSLFELQLTRDEFAGEPPPDNPTLAYCIERILVYTAWNDGFDYRIMTYEKQKLCHFISNMALNQKCMLIDKQIKNSKTYRIGQFILAVPKSIKKIFLKKRTT